MECIKCKKPAKIKIQNLIACESCFVKIIEKRVRKELRINHLINKNDDILIIDDKSPEAFVASFLLRRIIKDLPVRITEKKMSYRLGKKIKGTFTKVILPWSADKEDEYFLEMIFKDKEIKHLGHFTIDKKTYVKMLLPVLKSEIGEFAGIKGFTPKKTGHKTQAAKMLDSLERLYPEVKFSLLKSSQILSKGTK